MRKKQVMLDEGYITAVTELSLILSYADKDSEKKSTLQTSIYDISAYSSSYRLLFEKPELHVKVLLLECLQPSKVCIKWWWWWWRRWW